jgi:hypothetical protein
MKNIKSKWEKIKNNESVKEYYFLFKILLLIGAFIHLLDHYDVINFYYF